MSFRGEHLLCVHIAGYSLLRSVDFAVLDMLLCRLSVSFYVCIALSSSLVVRIFVHSGSQFWILLDCSARGASVLSAVFSFSNFQTMFGLLWLILVGLGP